MNPLEDNLSGVDEPTERLICRRLDGVITPREDADLNAILAGNPAARELLDDYRRNDVLAIGALRADFRSAAIVSLPRRPSGWRMATVGGLMAAAAVIALSIVPDLWRGDAGLTDGGRAPAPIVRPEPGAAVNPEAFQFARSRPGAPAESHFADYRDPAPWPYQRQRERSRQWIGIPSPDNQRILIIERNEQTTRMTPISGDI